ncbi:hypothetical protein QYE76_062358 [Lolium multiflorum]|uniref:Uncharacterized protein n=1 Tax=Lolium multiflorum TaxID=4521 RepID=A0AAD8W633_LOLMU|nr:hypothetical protein QYE76_062358 [Lolium multiflorum]
MVDPTGVQAMADPTGVQGKVDPSGVQAKVDPRRSFLRRFTNSNNTEASSSEKGEGSEDDSEDEDVETYKRLVNDGGQQLYPGCKKFSKLQFLGSIEGHSLPKKFHEAKQYIRGVGLAYDTYDVCFNDCIIFRGIHANANVCPVCKTSRWKTERSVVGGKRISRVARKVIRHFPLNKRVRRLFISNKTAALMSWHNDGRTKDDVMRHPADSPTWKNFDSKYRTFSKEPRNIRFGLATDGFNPFRNMNLSYSIWPIILIPYNFPPWICMKESNFILSVIVPGRRSPGKDIDVYLQLVIDELQELWHHGVLVHDAHFGKKFRVYAALLWTISDWLGRGILSGESIVVCSHCLLGTCSRRLKHGHKACFLGHRRFLSKDHAFRRDEESFDGTTDFRDPPVQPTGEEISAMTMDIQTAYGKLQKQKRSGRKKRSRGEGDEDLENKEEVHTVETTFKKRSIFFQLEYWKFLLVRHNLDSMHIEKNVFDNIVNTLLDVDKRSKDNAKARMDMKRMKIREHLHIDETQEKPDLPDAVYYMESSKKKIFCGLVKNVRFPDNHASSMFNKVRLEENKFVGLKNHDCHILFEEILPLAVMKTLPEEVALPLVKLAKCFKVITSKIVSNKEIAIVEDQLPEILCQLEKIFPPTFFDIMEHLVIHLPTEVRLAGPVQFRNMWSTEMFIGNMKNWVHNRSHPEGSIAESYLFDECLTFCSRYVDDCNTKFNRASRHDDNLTSSAKKGCSKYLTIFGRPLSACSTSELDYLSWTQAQKYVLFNYKHISSYTEKHMKALAAGKKRKSKRQVEAEHHRTFHTWFIDHVQSLLLKGTKLPEDIVLLANKPYMMVKKYNSYSINGCVFHTKDFAAGKSTQCDGVSNSSMTSSYSSSKDKNPLKGQVEYYGRIVEIVELNYSNQGSVVLFKCEWSKPAGVKNIANFGITQVNLKQLEFGSEPFIFASQAKQIYYVKDVVDDDWYSVVCPSIRDYFDMEPRIDRTNKSDTQDWREKMMQVGEAVTAGSNGATNMFERFIHIAKSTGYLPGSQQIVENETIYEQLEEDEDDDDDDEDDSDEEDEDGAEDGQRENDGEGYDSDATIDAGTEEEKSHRGPTLLKGFWKHVNPKCKIDVEFNDNGQPCGPNTSQFSNFIGSLVKGKEISMAATSWSKVPRCNKMHLWETVKAFFNVEERHRYWVLKSACKKWKDFKCYLKKKYYKSRLSIEENVANGCGQRLPEAQWDWLNEINDKLNANPELHGEEPNPNDLYSTLFPKAKKSTRYGLGMVVGGKGSENLAEALAALEESRKETRDLKLVVENMARKTDIIENQLSQLMLVYQASQKIQDNQQQQQERSEEGMEGIPTIQVTRPNVENVTSSEVTGCKANETNVTRSQKPSHTSEVGGSQAKETRSTVGKNVRRSQKPSHTSEVGGSQGKATTTHEDRRSRKIKERKSVKEPNSSVPKEAIYTQETTYSQEATYSQEGMFTHQVEGNHSKTTYKHLEAKTASVNKIIKSVKLEKAKENMTNSEVKKKRNKGTVNVTKGMDVALTSPTSEAVVAIGTVQNADTDEYIEVMINMVLKRTTRLPQAKGRMTLLGQAEAHSVQWPRKNVSTEKVDMTHASIMSSMDKNLRIHSRSDGRVLTLEDQAANRDKIRRRENPDSQNPDSTKRRRIFSFKSKSSIADSVQADELMDDV